MNWEAIGAISESIGALGVIASLIYVGNGVRASNIASSVTAKLNATQMLASYQDTMLVNPELTVLMAKGRNSYEELSKAEKLLFSTLALKATYLVSAVFFLFQHKLLTDEGWYESHAVANYWTSSRGYRQWWNAIGSPAFSGEFKEFMAVEVERADKQSLRVG